jgi:hypothetical protein
MTEMLFVKNAIFLVWHVTFTDSINANYVKILITDFLILNQVSANANRDSLKQECPNAINVITHVNSVWIINLNAYLACQRMFLSE